MVSIIRSDCLRQVSIWAPNLQHFSVRACFEVSKIDSLDEHSLSIELPEDHIPSKFVADITNVCDGHQWYDSLTKHPLISRVISNHDDDEYGAISL